VGGEAGMHLVAMLRDGLDDCQVAARAAEQKLWLWPLSPAYMGAAARQGLILGFGSTKASEMPRAVRRLCGVLAE